MKFERNKSRQIVKEIVWGPTPRRLAAAKRALKKQRNKYPLFAEQIALRQPTPEERVKQYDDARLNMIKWHRAYDAQVWRKARAMLSDLNPDSRERFLNFWNNEWRGPRTGTYLCNLIRHWDGFKMVWLKRRCDDKIYCMAGIHNI